MQTDPLISVVLPVYNGMPYLAEAVESILGQTFRRFEFIIVDDGSTDDTPHYLRSLPDPRVRYCRLQKVGLVGALNYGLEAARSPIIARMDADDISTLTRFEKQYGYLQSHPDCVLVSCHFEYMTLEGAFVREHQNLITDEAIRWQMLFTTPFVHPGAMFSRAAAAAAGNYTTEFPIAEDYDLWTRISRHGRLANYPESLLRYRCNPASVSAMNAIQQREQASRIAGIYAASVEPTVAPELGRELYMLLAAGEHPRVNPPAELVRAFWCLKARLGGSTPGVELSTQVRSTQQKLRWQCLDGCRKNAWHPVTLVRWLRLARGFDPEGTTFSALLRQRFGRLRDSSPGT